MDLKKILKIYVEYVISVMIYVLGGITITFIFKLLGFNVDVLNRVLCILAPFFAIYFVSFLSKKRIIEKVVKLLQNKKN